MVLYPSPALLPGPHLLPGGGHRRPLYPSPTLLPSPHLLPGRDRPEHGDRGPGGGS